MNWSEICVIFLTVQASALRVNLLNSKTVQSSTFSNHNSGLAIDGNTETCSITEQDSATEENPWWRVELDRIYNITDLQIYFASNRYVDFMSNLKIYVSSKDTNFTEHLCVSLKKPSDVSVEYIRLKCEDPFFGKFITVERIGGIKKNTLVLCEVHLIVDSKSINLAFKRPTEQSGIFFKSKAKFSVDHNLNTCAVIRSFGTEFAWWRVILDGSYYITNVNIYFAANLTEHFLRKHMLIYVSKDVDYFETHLCGFTQYPDNKLDERRSLNITCKKPILGTYVTIKKYSGMRPRWLILCEVEVFSKHGPREMNTSQVPKECLAYEYKCYEGRCIPQDWLCDGTEDCEQGDDEAPTCQTCGMGQIKCARIRKCIKSASRCDGNVNCPDFSDEQECFHLEMKTDFLTATFGGESDFYICSQNWNKKYSFHVCNQLNRYYLDTFYEPINDDTLKFITINRITSSKDNIPDIKYFQTGSKCRSSKFVKIRCESQKNETGSICGTRGNPDGDYEPYIINGNNALDGAWPWHAQIFINGYYKCGGSIVKENWILTSAHCLDTKISTAHIKVGTNIRNDPQEVEFPVSHIIMHPLYRKGDQHSMDDLALIRLKSPMSYSKFVRPICLPSEILNNRTLMSYRYCLISGFGHIDRAKSTPKYLQQGRMNFMSNHDCANYLAEVQNNTPATYHSIFKAHMFCAGSIPNTHGINICDGDSGGPFVCKNERRIWTLIGISTSSLTERTGLSCAQSFFTKVDRYLDFINKVFQQELAIEYEISRGSRKISVKLSFITMSLYVKIVELANLTIA